MLFQQLQQNLNILKNEQPLPNCKECEILWFQLLDYRNKWRARPTEFRWQELFEGAQYTFLEHWHTHQEEVTTV